MFWFSLCRLSNAKDKRASGVRKRSSDIFGGAEDTHTAASRRKVGCIKRLLIFHIVRCASNVNSNELQHMPNTLCKPRGQLSIHHTVLSVYDRPTVCGFTPFTAYSRFPIPTSFISPKRKCALLARALCISAAFSPRPPPPNPALRCPRRHFPSTDYMPIVSFRETDTRFARLKLVPSAL